MRKRISMPIIASALLMFAGTSQAVELTTNGGFETGDYTGWTQFENGGTQTIVTLNPSTGTYAANIVQDTQNNSLIKNANIGIGVVTPGQEVTISFDMRGTAVDGAVVFAEFFSELDGGGVSAAEILSGGPLFPNADPDVWTTFAFTAFAGPDVSGGVTLQLGAVCGGAPTCFADIYFDNVSVSVVPVPGAVWLFGSALGLLGWMKRRAA